MRNFKLLYKDKEVDLKHGLSLCGARIGQDRFELVNISIDEEFNSYELGKLIVYLNQLYCALSGNFNSDQNFELKEQFDESKIFIGCDITYGEDKTVVTKVEVDKENNKIISILHPILHNHPGLEKKLGLDHEHVIVDRKDWEKAIKFQGYMVPNKTKEK